MKKIIVFVVLLLSWRAYSKQTIPIFPLNQGEDLIPGCHITKIERTNEFMRITCDQQGKIYKVEIVYSKKSCPYWCTKHYRLQPALGAPAPPTAFLKRVMKRLKKLDNTNGFMTFVRQKKHVPYGSNIQYPITPKIITIIVLFLVLIFSTMMLMGLIHRTQWGKIITYTAGIALIAEIVALYSMKDGLPLKYITVLHESLTKFNIRQLYGQGSHAGLPLNVLISVFFGHGIILPWIAALNSAMALFFAVTGAAIGMYITKSPLFSLLWAGELLASPIFQASAVSELPSQTLGILFLAGLAGAWAWKHRAELPKWASWAAVINLMSATALAVWIRPDAGGIGLVAMTVIAYDILVRGKVRVWINNHIPLLVGLGLILGMLYHILLLTDAIEPNLSIPVSSLLHGFDLFGLYFLNLPVFLGFSISFTFPIVIVLGMLYLFKHPFKYLLLPLAIILVFQMDSQAAHAGGGPYFELFRYVSMLMPFLFFIGIYAWSFIQDIAERKRMSWWFKPLILLILFAGTYNPEAHGMKELKGEILLRTAKFYITSIYDVSMDDYIGGPLNTNQQIEVRYILDKVRQHPKCIFLTKVIKRGKFIQQNYDKQSSARYQLTIFGKPIKEPLQFSYNGPQSLKRTLAKLKDADCVLFYRGMDCNILGRDNCMDIAQQGKRIDSLTFLSMPYTWPQEYGIRHQMIRLELYKLK